MPVEFGRGQLRAQRSLVTLSSALAWWTIHQSTLGSLDTQRLELLGLLHGQDDSLDELLDLFVQPSNVGVRVCRLLIDLHRLDSRVILRWQSIENEVRILVDANEVSWLERLGGDESDEGEEDGLTSGSLDDGALALALRVQVDIGSLAGFLLVWVDVEDLP